MSLSVNTNVAAIGIVKDLENNQVNYNTEVTRLSTGLRINSAADDPAGLVIANNYSAEASGLGVAVQNANDGINMVQTAEGALQQISTALQDARDLALNAANTGPNDTATIAADQQQIGSIISTINGIVNNTQFGTKTLLNGAAGVTGVADTSSATFLSGTTATQTGNYAVSNISAATEGSLVGNALTTVGTTSATTAGSGGTAAAGTTLSFNGAGLNNFALDISGENLASTITSINNNATLQAAGVSASLNAAGTGLELSSTAIGQAGDLTATESTVGAGITGLGTTGGAPTTVAGGTATGASQLSQNETLTFTNGGSSQVSVSLTAGQTISEAVSTVNQDLQGAGITEQMSFSGGRFTVSNTAYGSASTVGNTFSSSLGASAESTSITTSAGSATVANGSAADASGTGTVGADVSADINGVATQGSGQILSGGEGTSAQGLQLQITGTANTNISVSNNSLTMQLGAFAHQTQQIAIANLSASQLGLGTTGLSGTTGTTSVQNIDVTKGNGAGAQDALLVLDSAIAQVSSARASLGSFQTNVLQSTEQNLEVSQQNMTDATSNIMDANLAQESLAFSKAQILNQTGISVLAQANQVPQQLLKLFQQ